MFENGLQSPQSPKSKKPCLTKPQNIDNSDEQYFESYSYSEVHENMIMDEERTMAYAKAILAEKSKLEGGRVLDVGAGTGILSLFAHQAGAERVFAVEASITAKTAQQLIQCNNAQNTVEVIHSDMESVQDLGPVDAIISEWMGHALLQEHMLPSFLLARDRFLKAGGLLFPCAASLFLAAVSNTSIMQHRFETNERLSGIYNVDLSPLFHQPPVLDTKPAHIVCVCMEDVISTVSCVHRMDLHTLSVQEAHLIEEAPFQLQITGGDDLIGFAIWFSVQFPDGSVLSTGPYDKYTHWQQCVVYVPQPVKSRQGHSVLGHMTMRCNEANHRCLDIGIQYRVIRDAQPEKKTKDAQKEKEEDEEEVVHSAKYTWTLGD